MIVSVNWLKKFADIDLPIDELVTLIGARLVEIEEVIDLGVKYNDVVVAKVVESKPLEGSDHLSVVRLDDNGRVEGLERDSDGYVQVVCGAPNMRTGLTVAWLPPKSIVPETFGTDDPFVLDSRKLRGVMSNGMIASARELALYDEHEGILELDDGLQAGASFAQSLELNDYLLDIENKSLTHRPDCFGVIGFAREVAAIQGKQFHTPEWLAQTELDYGEKQGDIAVPTVMIDDSGLSHRYQAVVLSEGDGGAVSPLWVQSYLARVGVRPINAIVDVTNYLMILTGQPLHAFDYDKLVAIAGGTADIHVRAGRSGETLTLLDGRTIELVPGDIVIAAGETPVALAGAMGGAATEIDATTKNIILESATFNLYNLRATQMRHGIFSEAITRFTKGQPAALTAPVLAEAIRLTSEFAGSKRISEVADNYPGQAEAPTIELTIGKINGVLGEQLTTDHAANTLAHAEFTVGVSDDALHVKAPFWRSDIHIQEDLVEEIGRLNGFDSIDPVLPRRDFTAVSPSRFDEIRSEIRRALTRAGANEVLTYSFVHGDVLRKSGQDADKSYRLTNSLSPDLQYYRQSLTPSLLGLIHGNVKAGFDSFALFEMNKVHSKTAELVDGVPAEMHRLGLVVAHKKPQSGAPYYQAKHLLEYLGDALGLDLVYRPFVSDANFAFARPFELRRSSRVVDVASNQSLGIVGEYKKSTSRSFKLPEYTAGFELLTEAVALALEHKANTYRPLSRYPGTERDICFQVGQTVQYQDIAQVVNEALAGFDYETSLEPIDLYQAEGLTTKNITLRIKLTAYDHTLTGDEVMNVTNTVVKSVTTQVGGRVI